MSGYIEVEVSTKPECLLCSFCASLYKTLYKFYININVVEQLLGVVCDVSHFSDYKTGIQHEMGSCLKKTLWSPSHYRAELCLKLISRYINMSVSLKVTLEEVRIEN